MAKHHQIGKAGEQLAARFLTEKGYTILERNWRFSKAEVDLIAKDGENLVFVEVKTRSTDYFGKPEEFVSPQKERLLAEAASVYMEQIGHQWAIRFDLISVIYRHEQDFTIEHLEDAFFPGLEF